MNLTCILFTRAGHARENLELRVTRPEPIYDNAQEIIAVENANKIRTEKCVAYDSMTRQ